MQFQFTLHKSLLGPSWTSNPSARRTADACEPFYAGPGSSKSKKKTALAATLIFHLLDEVENGPDWTPHPAGLKEYLYFMPQEMDASEYKNGLKGVSNLKDVVI